MFHTGEGTFSSNAVATLVAILILVLPVLSGLVVGAHVRERGWSLPRRIALAFAPLALGLLVVSHAQRSVFWDVVVAGVGFLCALPLGRRGARARVAFQLLMAVMLAEGALRLASRERYVPEPNRARLTTTVTNLDPPCRVIFPDRRDNSLPFGAPDGRPAVMHLGDSLVEGAGCQRREAFPSLLAGLQPSVRHVNLGVAGAGPDAYLFALEQWAPVVRPRLAVVYIFLGNDFVDLDRDYLCCAGGPLYADTSDRPARRCLTPRWAVSFSRHTSTDPSPFAFRALAYNSVLAWRLQLATQATPGWLQRMGIGADHADRRSPPPPPRWGLLAQRMRALRRVAVEKGAALLIVALPDRVTLERSFGRSPSAPGYWEPNESGEAAQHRVVAEARALGIDALDAWEPVRAAVARVGFEAFFARQYPGDAHFSPAGHRIMAAWLAPAIEERLRRTGAGRLP